MIRIPSAALLTLLAAFLVSDAQAQANWGEVAGRVTQAENGASLPGANILVSGTNYGTAADDDGQFRLRLPVGRYRFITRAVGFEQRTDSVTVQKGQTASFNPALSEEPISVGEARVEGRGVDDEAGVFVLDPKDVQAMPTPVADALRAVKVLPGVTSNNETSNAYSVRGGGYSENQFFIDGFEIYRPLRTEQGEQEGLGLVNNDLAERLTLYAGGFPARYGGKLSSVLDVQYTRPSGRIGGTVYGSTLDGGASLGGGFLDGRLGLAVAARTARPRRFFSGQELEGLYDPNFRDIQAVADLQLTSRHALHALGILARHRFRLEPSQRETTFGIFPNLLRTVAFRFDGLEEDGYDVRFGGLRLSSRLGSLLAEHSISFFETDEFETFDVEGDVTLYRLERDPNRPPDDPFTTIQTGQARQRDVAQNRVQVSTLTGGGRYRAGFRRHAAEVGWQLRGIRFDDDLTEFSQLTGRDSLGSPVAVTVDSLADAAQLDTWQASLWAEDAWDLLPMSGRLVATLGLRADHFDFNSEWTFSPRLSLRYRYTEATTLTGAAGVYHQAPTYRELRGEPAPGETIIGALNRDLESQQAALLVLGAEHFFSNTRWSVRAETYYKRLRNLISYEIENTRVLYAGENDTEGYAFGFDAQLRGELVPGLESWLNYGFLKTDERFLAPYITERNDGLRARPTDRRHNIALFVQDYVPGSDDWTLHLRTLFGTGLPYTPPAVSERINGVTAFEPGQRTDGRYPEYFRFDMGATRRVRVGRIGADPVMLRLTAEVLNVFNQKNTILFTFVDSGQGFFEGVPTRLTPRTINVRARLSF